jgi:outer membrane murein-binding lipoprotein Lpp
MKYSVAVMLLIGAMSTAEALNLESHNTGFLQADMDQESYNNEISAADKQATKESVAEAQKKAQEAAKKAKETK